MNCDDVRELLAGYVFGALEPEELAAVEAHLREGREHDDELIEMRATLFALDRYEAAARPSPSLVHRIRMIAQPDGHVVEPGSRVASRFGPPAFRFAAAAAVLLVAFAAGLLAGGLLFDDDGRTVAFGFQGEAGAYMEVRGSTEASSVTVIMTGLERLPDNSYQVWAQRDGDWLSVGVCNTNAEGEWIGDFDFGIREGDSVILTVEPRGGSEEPTGEAILGAAF